MSATEPPRLDEEIIRDLYADLVRFAAIVAARGDEPDDLVHDALVATMARRSLAELDNPRAYLRRAMVNLASNRRRSLARRMRAMVRVGPAAPVDDTYPSEVEALLDLSAETRGVLWLADIEGLAFEEIAAELGSTASATRQRASRGRAEIRERAGRGEFGDHLTIEGASG